MISAFFAASAVPTALLKENKYDTSINTAKLSSVWLSGGAKGVGANAAEQSKMLFVVPVFYIIFEFLQEKIRKPMEEEPDAQVLLEKERSHAEQSTFGNEKKK